MSCTEVFLSCWMSFQTRSRMASRPFGFHARLDVCGRISSADRAPGRFAGGTGRPQSADFVSRSGILSQWSFRPGMSFRRATRPLRLSGPSLRHARSRHVGAGPVKAIHPHRLSKTVSARVLRQNDVGPLANAAGSLWPFEFSGRRHVVLPRSSRGTRVRNEAAGPTTVLETRPNATAKRRFAGARSVPDSPSPRSWRRALLHLPHVVLPGP